MNDIRATIARVHRRFARATRPWISSDGEWFEATIVLCSIVAAVEIWLWA